MSHFIFHNTFSFFKSKNINQKKILVAVSGGVDSIVLLDILKQISSPQKLDLSAIYVHHGGSPQKKINDYRREAQELVQNFCEQIEVPLIVSEQPQKELKNEKEFREFRHEQFQKIAKKKKQDFVALAHHKDDLLETRLINLIRGCGVEGLKSMTSLDGNLLRPFLSVPRDRLLGYAQEKKLKWVEDPSNEESLFLRNWIRNHWLPELEKHRAGALFRLGESLDLISSSLVVDEQDLLSLALTGKGLSRHLLESWPIEKQKRVLVLYLKHLGITDYGQSHIEEIFKHFQRKEKKITFKLLKKDWVLAQDVFSLKEEDFT